MKKLSYQDYLDGTGEILKESQKEAGEYITTVAGREFIVLPNVFSPKYFNDTEAFAQNLPVTKGEVMLEIGPGTGAISITAAYKGASHILAIDINPSAVENTRRNIALHHMEDRVEVREGDLYGALKEGEKFDVIFWNTPFGFVPEDQNVSALERAVYDPGYKATERFVLESRKYLKPGGRVYIGYGSTQGRMDLIEKFVKEAGYSMRLIYQTDSVEKHPVSFEIFELK